MKITTTGRKCTLRPSFVSRTEEKLSKLDKFFDAAASADVTVSTERNKQRVEVTIRCNGMVFRAEELAEDANEAVDRLIDVLVRQIRKNKTRLEKRLREGAFAAEFAGGEPVEEEAEFRVVRSKSFPVKPLDVEELLHTLGLYDHRNKLPNQLSGGQQQRTAIGRAIVKNPDILLCDEPTGALDYNTSKEILKLIEKVNQKYGNTVIMVTHNDAIKDMADRVVRLRDGMIRKNYLNEQKLSADALDW